ncbi:MAG: FecR family protein [Cytophagaceae bacterium]
MRSRENKKLDEVLRERFSDAEISGETPSWGRIEAKLEKQNLQKTPLGRRNFYVAASVLVIVTTSLGLWFYSGEQKNNTIADKADSVIKEELLEGQEPEVLDNSSANQEARGKDDVDIQEDMPSKPAPVKKPLEIKEPTRLQAAKGNQKFVLPDSSLVHLDKGAVLTYDGQYNLQERRLNLSGKAHFKVKAGLPFIIEGLNSTTTVKGTSFYLNSKKEEDEIFVTSGLVEFSKGNATLLLQAEQGAIAQNHGGVSLNSNANIASWQTGVLKFEKVAVKEVLSELSALYGRVITAENKTILNCSFTGSFRNLELSKAMNLLATSIYGKWEENEQGEIILTGPGCE